jgi:hypothetical protein
MHRARRRAAFGAAIAIAVAAAHAAAAAAVPVAPQVTDACPAGVLDGGYCGDGGPVTDAKLAGPRGVAALADGGYLVADSLNSAIRRVDAAGTISTVAGIGVLGSKAPPKGKPASVASFALGDPRGVAALPDGSFAIADTALRAVLLVGTDGRIRTLRDRNTLVRPVDVVTLDADTVLVVDAGAGRVREIDVDGTTRTVATGLTNARRAAVDASTGAIYVSEQRTSERGDVVRLAPDGSRSIVAGTGAPGAAGNLPLEQVAGLVAGGGAFLVAGDQLVRGVLADASVRVVAGDRTPASPALSVSGVALEQPDGLALTASLSLLIADSVRDQIATVPDVLQALSGPPPPEMHAPEIESGGERSYGSPAPTKGVSNGTSNGPPCARGSLSPAFKALLVRNGKVHVRFNGKGTVQVSLVVGKKEQQIYRKEFKTVSSKRKPLMVKPKKHGKYFVRVRAPGGCNQTNTKLKV